MTAPVPADQEEALREALGEPHCWVVPGRDTANDYGFLDAHCCQEGEMSRPLWPLEDIKSALATLRAERDQLASELRQSNHFLALRTRQNTQASQAWARAAEQALAGDPRALHDRLRLHRDSAATDAKIVQSALSDPRPSPAKGDK